MILTCPSCNCQFRISPDILGEHGRKVKCTECGDVWFQEKKQGDDEDFLTGESDDEDAKDALDQLDDLDEESLAVLDQVFENLEHQQDDIQSQSEPDLPAMHSIHKPAPVFVSQQSKSYGYAASFAVFILLLLPLLLFSKSVLSVYPQSIVFYQIFGIKMDVPGENLVFDRIQARYEGKTLIVEGRIQNLGRKAQAIPLIEAQLRDSHGNILETWHIQAPENEVSSEGVVSFLSAYTPAIDKIDNTYDVKLRFVLRKNEAKTGAEGDGNTPAPPEGDQAHPSDHAEVLKSHPHASSAPHPESSH